MEPPTVHSKPSHATKEYLKNVELLEACFQCFVNKKLPNKVCYWMFYDAGYVIRYFNAVYLKEEPPRCN